MAELTLNGGAGSELGDATSISTVTTGFNCSAPRYKKTFNPAWIKQNVVDSQNSPASGRRADNIALVVSCAHTENGAPSSSHRPRVCENPVLLPLGESAISADKGAFQDFPLTSAQDCSQLSVGQTQEEDPEKQSGGPSEFFSVQDSSKHNLCQSLTPQISKTPVPEPSASGKKKKRHKLLRIFTGHNSPVDSSNVPAAESPISETPKASRFGTFRRQLTSPKGKKYESPVSRQRVPKGTALPQDGQTQRQPGRQPPAQDIGKIVDEQTAPKYEPLHPGRAPKDADRTGDTMPPRSAAAPNPAARMSGGLVRLPSQIRTPHSTMTTSSRATNASDDLRDVPARAPSFEPSYSPPCSLALAQSPCHTAKRPSA